MTNFIEENKEKRSFLTVLTLWFFTGRLGGHRYYLKNYKRAALMTYTFGGFGAWTIIDLFFLKRHTVLDDLSVESSFLHPKWGKFADKLTFISTIFYSFLPLFTSWLYIIAIIRLTKDFGIPTWDDITLYLLFIVIFYKIVQLPMYLFFLCLYSNSLRQYPFLIVLMHLGIGSILLRVAISLKNDTPLFTIVSASVAILILVTGFYRFVLYLIVARKKEIEKRKRFH